LVKIFDPKLWPKTVGKKYGQKLKFWSKTLVKKYGQKLKFWPKSLVKKYDQKLKFWPKSLVKKYGQKYGPKIWSKNMVKIRFKVIILLVKNEHFWPK